MKYKYIILLLSLLSFSASYALPGLTVTSPDKTRVAAKYAKQKAKIQSDDIQISDEDIARNTDGCDLNVGNLSIEQGVTDVPDELIVIVEGDIIQANECQAY